VLIGVISDTHGLLRPEALTALAGVEHILHAGDVGNIDILATLKEIAPVTAIRGNIDIAGPCAELPATEIIELAGCLIYMVHAIADIDIKPEAANVGLVIYGHSHTASVERHGSVLYLNPGSAGPRRFSKPITLARVNIINGIAEAEIIELPLS
jgi:putative phosphoesterase